MLADPAPPPVPRCSMPGAQVWIRIVLLLAVTGCDNATATDPRPLTSSPTATRPAPGSAFRVGSTAGEGPLVSFLGDSITAGLHLPADEAFPDLVAARLAAAGRPIRHVNAGLSGDTTSGGLRRLAWQLKQSPDLVVVELGANDALRGQGLASVEENLRAIVQRAKSSGALVLLLGMKIPPNYGLDYTLGFEQLYARIADEEDVPLIPFFMQDVVLKPGMMLSDGLHPTAAGHSVLADTLMPELLALLDTLEHDRE